MQLLELWQMAKLVLKQSIKAHGPLVVLLDCVSRAIAMVCVGCHYPSLRRIFSETPQNNLEN